MLANNKIIRYPIKIGDSLRISEYAATLLSGEEQLLVTRDCKLFLTVGDGTFKEFKTNSSYTVSEIDEKVNILNQADSDIKNSSDIFKQTMFDSISIIDQELTNHDKDIADIKTSDIAASRILVDVPINGTTLKLSLQDVIGNILTSVGGYIIPSIIGESECGTTECGA